MARWASTTKKVKDRGKFGIVAASNHCTGLGLTAAPPRLLYCPLLLFILIIYRGRTADVVSNIFVVMFLSSSVVNTTTASALEVSFWLGVSILLLSPSLTFMFYFFLYFLVITVLRNILFV